MNTLPRSLLTPEKVLLIKEKLWDGALKQYEIAEEFSVTQTTISRIFRGHEHSEVPWPDNSTGPIPIARWETLIRSKRRGARYANSQRQEPTEFVKKAAANVASILEDKNPSLDSEFASIISNPNSKSDRGDVGGGNAKKLLPWLEIKEQDPAHPLIREVEARQDGHLKAAMMLVLRGVPLEEWQRKPTLALIKSTREKLEKERKM